MYLRGRRRCFVPFHHGEERGRGLYAASGEGLGECAWLGPMCVCFFFVVAVFCFVIVCVFLLCLFCVTIASCSSFIRTWYCCAAFCCITLQCLCFVFSVPEISNLFDVLCRSKETKGPPAVENFDVYSPPKNERPTSRGLDVYSLPQK